MMKQGSATANTLGVLAVMYSGFGVLLSWGRGIDDELNTLTAATATGLLYKSTGENSCLVCCLQHLYSLSMGGRGI